MLTLYHVAVTNQPCLIRLDQVDEVTQILPLERDIDPSLPEGANAKLLKKGNRFPVFITETVEEFLVQTEPQLTPDAVEISAAIEDLRKTILDLGQRF